MKQITEQADRTPGTALPYPIWISRAQRVISFHPVPDAGYEVMEFPSRQAQMKFVVDQSADGFRVQ